ncbi:unnamed protein product [Symbiodinium sp. CCMP2592]|nr:unnamed protein product [Symbiodinium sp. CCMP2592]
MSTIDMNEVADWVVSLPGPIRQYVDAFRDNAVDGKLLMQLTDADLQDMGIEKLMHRKSILVHRRTLLEEGFNETLRGQWHLESAYEIQQGSAEGAVPELLELRAMRFAPRVLEHMCRTGMRAGASVRAATTQMDALLCDQHDAIQGVEALEAMNHLTFHRTADGRVREEIESDLQMVLQAKTAARERSIKTQGKNKQLAVAIDRFCKECKSAPSDASMQQASASLASTFLQWRDEMLQVVNASFVHTEGLLQRTSARLQSQTPGGAALQGSIEAFSEVTQRLYEAAERCKRIYSLADPDVQLALEARDVGLAGSISSEEEKLHELEGRRDEVKERLLKQNEEMDRYGKLRRKQVANTKEIRDFHIKRWWKWAWEGDMKEYEKQVQGDVERMKHDEQVIAEKCKDLQNDLMQIEKDIETQKTYLARLRKMASPNTWENVLRAEDLFAAEAEVKEHEEKRLLIEGQLRRAMIETGVIDPGLAVQIITQHETSKILLSETTTKSKEAAARLQEFVSQMGDVVLAGSNGSKVDREDLEALAESIMNINELHEEHMHRLAKKKDAVLSNVVASVAAFKLQDQLSLTDGREQP